MSKYATPNTATIFQRQFYQYTEIKSYLHSVLCIPMLVPVSNPCLVLCSLLSCKNVLSENETNKNMSFCSANLYITGQTHWDSCSLQTVQSVTFLCTDSIKAEQLTHKFLVNEQLQFDEFFRKQNFHGGFF